MAYSITCRDSGTDCPGHFVTETEDELMQHIEMHGKVAHPQLEMTPEFVAQIKGLVKTV